ncbi:DUF6265 family protein [Sphingomonas sp. dw_22]|uniref:DUF6265 family protein n=1 Tax=Sphingomonas sp. dw_22 TaxID=2721175 RepID=UPI001BD1F0FE|nr:DUF6265 family protein [Sphingomonas sp. dw_22]
MIRCTLAALLLCLAPPALAQETRSLAAGAQSPAATLDQLAWLAGTWRGEGLGAPATEVYSAPQAGRIAGHFLQEDGKGGIEFYELMQIVPRGESLVYRLRHFNADLTGWEDATGKAVEFPLVAIEKDAIHFDGLTFRITGPRAMTCWVRIRHKDGSTEEMPFRYVRD